MVHHCIITEPLHGCITLTGGVVVSGLFLPLLQNLEIVIELGRGQSTAESRSSKK